MAKKQFSENHHHSISPKRILGSVVALIVFFLLLTSVIGLGQKYFTLKSRSKELSEEQSELTQKEKTLSETNAYLATPEGTEESLRERYNYIKPGEQIIVITPDPAASTPEPSTGIVHWWQELLKGLGIRK